MEAELAVWSTRNEYRILGCQYRLKSPDYHKTLWICMNSNDDNSMRQVVNRSHDYHMIKPCMMLHEMTGHIQYIVQKLGRIEVT
jgi:hypothetical protein